MTEQQEQLLQEYVSLKGKEKELKDKINALKPKIMEFLPEDGVSSEFGTFSFQERTTWQYSDEVKKLQQLEQKDGTAVAKVSKSLRFTPSKK